MLSHVASSCSDSMDDLLDFSSSSAAVIQPTDSQQKKQQSKPATNDPFAWVGITPSSSNASQSSMSMAERLANQSRSSPGSGSSSSKQPQSDPWNFDLFEKSMNSNSSKTSAAAAAQPQQDLLLGFAFDDNNGTRSAAPSTASTTKAASTTSTTTTTPTTTNSNDDYDNILGDLAKPVPKKPPSFPSKQPQNISVPSSSPSSSPVVNNSTSNSNAPIVNNYNVANSSRSTASPPPHILGQLVQMGFDIKQSNNALKRTKKNDWDIQAALELILSENQDSPRTEQPSQEPPRQPRQTPRSRPSRQDLPSNNSNDANSAHSTEEFHPDFMAQASQLGINVFQRANSFWNQSKTQIQKAIDEHGSKLQQQFQQTSPSQQNGKQGRSNSNAGRPKWWVNGMEYGNEGERSKGKATTEKFRDVNDGREEDENSSNDVPPPRKHRNKKPEAPNTLDLFGTETTPSEKFQSKQPQPQKPSTSKPGLIWDDEETHTSSSSRTSTPVNGQGRRQEKAASSSRTNKRKRPENQVSATNEQYNRHQKLKQNGNEKFSLGQYAAAEEFYTKAIDALPVSHIDRVIVLNNRAATRGRIGMSKEAAVDSNAIIGSILNADETVPVLDGLADIVDAMDLSGSVETTTSNSTEKKKIKLVDQLIKAVVQRAKSLESHEKWKDAGRDWNALRQSETLYMALSSNSQLRGIVNEGSTRCHKALNPTTTQTHRTTLSTPRQAGRPSKTPPKKSPSPNLESGEAVKNLKAKEAAQAREEEERMDLYEGVSDKVAAWKKGKEGNVRALLASLDTVLWPEKAKEVKTGMHELVTPAQVKRRYTITIAKLHPDKLPTASTTVEQRMIADSVFSALNDAWVESRQ